MFFLMIGLTWEFNHFLHGDVTVNKWDWPSIYDGFMLVYDYKIDGGYAVERVCKQTFRKLGVAFFFLNLHDPTPNQHSKISNRLKSEDLQ